MKFPSGDVRFYLRQINKRPGISIDCSKGPTYPFMQIGRGAVVFLLLMLVSASAFGESKRIYDESAIISVPYKPSVELLSAFNLSSLDRESFGALRSQSISSYVRVIKLKNLRTDRIAGPKKYSKLSHLCSKAVVKRLLRHFRSLRCEPNWEVTVDRTANDPSIDRLYALNTTSVSRIRAPEAWDLTTGSSDVVVGILDTGVDYNHPDLTANIWTNTGEIAGNGIDDDSNGVIDDVHGADMVNSDGNPMDDHYHGTHVAGTIGAVGNDGVGIAGVNWSVKMIACKFLNASGSGSTSGAISCLNYLKNLKQYKNVPIVATNNSWGGGGYSVALKDAIASQRDNGILFIAAAGNNGRDNDATAFYPANYTLNNVVSVAAVDANGNLASFSNYGVTTVDIAAPGVSIYSTSPNNTYRTLSGTSMATPHVTGVVALLKAYASGATSTDIVNALFSGGVELSSLSGKSVTGKTLNAFGALQAIGSSMPPNSSTIIPTITAEPTYTQTTAPPTLTPTVLPTEAQPTNTPISPTPTMTPIPPTATPVPPTATATPIPPTATPTPIPASLSIGTKRSRTWSEIICTLSRGTGYVRTPLSNYAVTLFSKEGVQRGVAQSDEFGRARFPIRVARTYYCEARVDDGAVTRSRSVLAYGPLIKSKAKSNSSSNR